MHNILTTAKVLADKFGIPAEIGISTESGRLVLIRHYPATNYKPHRVYAIWKGFDGETVRKRIPDSVTDTIGWSTEFDARAVYAAGLYLEWLKDKQEGYIPVLTGIGAAYDGPDDSTHAVIVSWTDSRSLTPRRLDCVKARASELRGAFKRIDNDSNGNPRYYFHELSLGYSGKFDFAARGFRKYRGKQYGGGYTVSTYNLTGLCEELAEFELAEFKKERRL